MAIKDDLKQAVGDDGKTMRIGVFYKEHPDRRHGKVKDKQFIIRYTIAGVTRTEAYGWLSDGFTAQAAQDKIKTFRANHKNGNTPVCLADETEAINAARAKVGRKETTFCQFFEEVYFPQCEMDKTAQTARGEELLFNNWISPVIGNLRFEQISIDHLDKIKANMFAGKRKPSRPHPRDKSKKARNAQERRTPPRPLSPRYVNYAMAVVRQVWNRACASKPALAVGDWPGASKSFKKPKVDNQRKRYLSRNETALLLQALKKKSQDVHDMALLSLHCGMRAGEIFKLTWDKVNLPKGEMLLVDTKNGESRTTYLTDNALAMLRQRSMACEHKRFVFITTIKKELAPYNQVPVTFSRTVKELGLNEGVTDSRDKIVFHSLRHTYASWLIDKGASLPIVRDLLGHKNLIMTSRYSHTSADAQKEAVAALSRSMQPTDTTNVVDINGKRNTETGTN
jgi:integrase